MEVDLRLIQSLGRWIIAGIYGIYGIYNSVLVSMVSIVSIDTEVEMKEETDVVVVEN